MTGLVYATGNIRTDGMVASATTQLRQLGLPRAVPVDVEVRAENAKASPSAGLFILLVAETSTGCLLAASRLSERGVTAHAMATACAEDLMMNIRGGGCVDEYLQDQLVLFMALASGTSRLLVGGSELTLHTQTAMHWCREMLPGCAFTVTRAKPTGLILECHGVGYRSRFQGGEEEEDLAAAEKKISILMPISRN